MPGIMLNTSIHYLISHSHTLLSSVLQVKETEAGEIKFLDQDISI